MKLSARPQRENDPRRESCYCDLWHSFEFLQVAHNSDASSARALQPGGLLEPRDMNEDVYRQGWGELLEQHTHARAHAHTHVHIYHPHVTGRELNPYYLVAAYDRLIINCGVVRTPPLSPHIYPSNNYNAALIKEILNRQACKRWIQSHPLLVPKGRFILWFDKTATHII